MTSRKEWVRFKLLDTYQIEGQDLNTIWAIACQMCSMEKMDAEERRRLGKIIQYSLEKSECLG